MIPIILVFTSFLPVSASEVLQSVVQQEFDQSREPGQWEDVPTVVRSRALRALVTWASDMRHACCGQHPDISG